jgi:tetratricopeptide (TPR) repeat protein/TolB-like protein
MSDQLEQLRTALSGRYDVKRELGRGGMATVYLALDMRHDRKVALKVLRPDLAAALGPDRFLREITIAASLQHPHILPVFDSGQAIVPTRDGASGQAFLYYVMPYVEGESLREHLRRHGEMPIADAVRVLRDVAEALDAAHEAGVVHRDIKPDNVLLSGRSALVMDFGVAKAVTAAAGSRGLTSTGVALGTPTYMAPEQAAADPVDHRADIYAFGVLAYEVLTGRPPFEGRSAQAVIAGHLADPPPPIAIARPTVPPALAALVMRCLAKRASDRWQSARELLAHLEQAATAPEAPPPRAAPRMASRVGWRRLLWIGGMVAAVVVGVLAVPTLRTHGTSGPNPRRVVVAPFEDATGDPALAGLGALLAEWIPRELERTLGDVVEVVPAQTLRDARRRAGADSAMGLTALARLVGAGTGISGSVRLVAGRVRFEPEIIDVGTGTLLRVVEPLGAPRDSAEHLVATVAERAVIAVGREFSPRFQWWAGRTPPPSLAAFREVEAGWDEFVRGRRHEAIAHWDRSRAMGSSSVQATLKTWLVYFGMGRSGDLLMMQRAESVLVMAEAREDGVLPLERADIRLTRAVMDGDREGAYRIAEDRYRISSLDVYGLALNALRTNRPRRAIEVFSAHDVAGTWQAKWNSYWYAHAQAYHFADRAREALGVVLRGQQELPGDDYLVGLAVRLRAALGQGPEVSDALEQASTLLPERGVSLALAVAAEYRAHGHDEMVERPRRRVKSWLASEPTPQSGGPSELMGAALYELGRWEEARSVYEALVTERPASVARLWGLGTASAQLGRRDEALAVAERLRTLPNPYLYGDNTRARAAIHAVLGDAAEAVALLREAYSQGLQFSSMPHGDLDFEGLRSYKPFVEWMRPRG